MIHFLDIDSYGRDCTTSYHILLDKEYTVKEFIEYIFKERPNEWGSISIRINEEPYECIDACSYSRTKIENKFEQQILSKSIKDIRSCGGWSKMDYVIYI